MTSQSDCRRYPRPTSLSRLRCSLLVSAIVRGWISLVDAGQRRGLRRGGYVLAGTQNATAPDVSRGRGRFTFLYLTRDTFSPWENLGLPELTTTRLSSRAGADYPVTSMSLSRPALWPEDRPDTILDAANLFPLGSAEQPFRAGDIPDPESAQRWW